jgi:hypothetical protein
MAPPFDELCYFIEMKEIQLTQGQVALVDDEDFEYLNQWKWYALKHPHGYYAIRNITSGLNQQKKIFMHRFIMGVSLHKDKVDHIFGNTLDNRRSHLRVCTNSENTRNQVKSRDEVLSSKYKGLSYLKNKGRYVVRITIEDKVIYLGSSKNERVAAKIYNEGAIKYHGEFAKLNIID